MKTSGIKFLWSQSPIPEAPEKNPSRNLRPISAARSGILRLTSANSSPTLSIHSCLSPQMFKRTTAAVPISRPGIPPSTPPRIMTKASAYLRPKLVILSAMLAKIRLTPSLIASSIRPGIADDHEITSSVTPDSHLRALPAAPFSSPSRRYRIPPPATTAPARRTPVPRVRPLAIAVMIRATRVMIAPTDGKIDESIAPRIVSQTAPVVNAERIPLVIAPKVIATATPAP